MTAAAANQELFALPRQLPQRLARCERGFVQLDSEPGLTSFSRSTVRRSHNYPSVEFFPLPKETSSSVIQELINSGRQNSNSSSAGITGSESNFAQRPRCFRPHRKRKRSQRMDTQLGGSERPPATAATSASRRASLKLLLFGFLGGFILNLMPCVLPVISLKIFGFVQHAGESRREFFAAVSLSSPASLPGSSARARPGRAQEWPGMK